MRIVLQHSQEIRRNKKQICRATTLHSCTDLPSIKVYLYPRGMSLQATHKCLRLKMMHHVYDGYPYGSLVEWKENKRTWSAGFR